SSQTVHLICQQRKTGPLLAPFFWLGRHLPCGDTVTISRNSTEEECQRSLRLHALICCVTHTFISRLSHQSVAHWHCTSCCPTVLPQTSPAASYQSACLLLRTRSLRNGCFAA